MALCGDGSGGVGLYAYDVERWASATLRLDERFCYVGPEKLRALEASGCFYAVGGWCAGREYQRAVSRHQAQFEQAMHRPVRAATAEACARFEQLAATISVVWLVISC